MKEKKRKDLPSPCPGVGSAFHENILACCSSGSNTVDTSLVELLYQLVRWFIMEFVVAVEDDVSVALKLTSNGVPVLLEIRCALDDAAVVSAEVLGVNDCVSAFASDVVHNILEAGEVGGVGRAGH